MSINKHSTNDDICNFLRQKGFVRGEKIMSKFKEENIKGNEIFFLEKDDFTKELGFKYYNKMDSTLNEIKKNDQDLLIFTENINDKSSEKDVYNFLKYEFKLDENILLNFKDINGKKLRELKIENLKELKLKLGERRKLIKYFEINKNNDKIENKKELSIDSTVEEVCEFLKNKFNLNEDSLNNIIENNINGYEFFNIKEDDFEELSINDLNIQKEILNYIN